MCVYPIFELATAEQWDSVIICIFKTEFLKSNHPYSIIFDVCKGFL